MLESLGADLDRVRNRVRRLMVQRLLEPEEATPPEARRGDPSLFEEREKLVLTFLLQGETTSGIADVLGVSKETVGEIVEALIEKLKEVCGDHRRPVGPCCGWSLGS